MAENENIPVIPSDWAMPKLFHRKITLASGRELNGYAQRSNIADEVWVYPEDNLSMIELVTLFGDPNNTQTIACDMSKDEHNEYVGYTNMMSVGQSTTGKLTVRMSKPIV